LPHFFYLAFNFSSISFYSSGVIDEICFFFSNRAYFFKRALFEDGLSYDPFLGSMPYELFLPYLGVPVYMLMLPEELYLFV
jgi:hypothetical protein